MFAAGRFINHDDNIADKVLDKQLNRTAIAWQKQYNEPYMVDEFQKVDHFWNDSRKLKSVFLPGYVFYAWNKKKKLEKAFWKPVAAVDVGMAGLSLEEGKEKKDRSDDMYRASYNRDILLYPYFYHPYGFGYYGYGHTYYGGGCGSFGCGSSCGGLDSGSTSACGTIGGVCSSCNGGGSGCGSTCGSGCGGGCGGGGGGG
jgi:hypothetical protein